MEADAVGRELIPTFGNEVEELIISAGTELGGRIASDAADEEGASAAVTVDAIAEKAALLRKQLEQAQSNMPQLHPGLFLQQPAPPPYMCDENTSNALRKELDTLGEGLLQSAAEEWPERATKLAMALSDARLLGTTLFRTIPGRRVVRLMLAAMRAAGRPELAEAVVHGLVGALQRSPAGAWTPADAEAVVEHATALLLAFTAERPRTAADLFALRWDLASRLVGRVQLLGGELGAAEGALRPKALVFCAMAHDRYNRKAEAAGLYFEAWAELLRRQLVPSALEADLIAALAELHFDMKHQERQGVHIAEKAYYQQGDAPEALYSKYAFLHVQSMASRYLGDFARASALSEEAIAVLDALGPAYATVLVRALTAHFFNLVLSGPGKLPAARKSWQRCIKELIVLDDPALPENDVNVNMSVRNEGDRAIPRTVLQYLTIGLAAAEKNDPQTRTPLKAHYHFWLGETLLALGRPKKAGAHYATAGELYRTRFPHAFAADCPRLKRVLAALEEIRVAQLLTQRSAPASWGPGLFARLFGARAGVYPAPEAAATVPR
eukprot:tig00020848_g14565.t1